VAGVAWLRRGEAGRERLRWFGAAVALLFFACAGVLLLFAGACDRYQAEFLPPLALLACCGLFEWERRSRFRGVVRAGAGLLLAASLAAGWCASHKSGPESCTTDGNRLVTEGRFAEAERRYRVALRVDGDFAPAHHGLGLALGNLGRREEAVAHHRAALRLKPDFPEARNALGVALLGLGWPAEAEVEFALAARQAPAMAEAPYGRALALFRLGRRAEAIAALEETLRRRPDFAVARERLAREAGEAAAR
jgi:tetratricopeptide (TPR) repeat protein